MSDRIAVMRQGTSSRSPIRGEIYEHPKTVFVADFIGSLNALDFRVDEVANGLAVMRLGDSQRLVVPVGAGTQAGAKLRMAVRPERIRIEPLNGGAPDEGSRVEGTITELVYLGGLTHFHVDAGPAGRVISHRMDDEVASSLQPGGSACSRGPPSTHTCSAAI